jgi:hypothetical protein
MTQSEENDRFLTDIRQLISDVTHNQQPKSSGRPVDPIPPKGFSVAPSVNAEEISNLPPSENIPIDKQKSSEQKSYTPTFSQIEKQKRKKDPDLSDLQKMIRDAAKKDPNQNSKT